MVYIAGDNDLEEYVVKDLENELGLVGSSPQVQVVALTDRIPGYDHSRGDWTTTKLFHVSKGLKAAPASAVADWGERNLGDPQTLAEFVSWSKKNYPAEHYALYMWGHGWNWHPGYTMEDQSNHDALDPPELKSVLPQLGQIDLVAYDGCNMASIEVDALWYQHAQAIVHSQEFVGWDGIEYDLVLKQLQQNPQLNAEQLAIITNRSASGNQEKTGSAIALDRRFGNLLQAVDEWSLALLQGLGRFRPQYAQAFRQTLHFVDAPQDLDLYGLAEQMVKQVPDPLIQAKSRQLMNALKATVLDEWHIQEYAGANGLSISRVPAADEYKTYYKASDFARYTSWDQFLDAYRD